MKRVALLGMPNTGKSTFFNRLTGASARVGNWPGITVELMSAKVLLGGAMGLGAAGRVTWLVGLWAVAAAVTLAMVGMLLFTTASGTSSSRPPMATATRDRIVKMTGNRSRARWR